MTTKRICVIGAGSSGLAAIKSCREEQLEVDCYEKSDHYGGLWCYHDDDLEELPSVMKSTIINTSKEMSAFSDFPPPEHFANYMHNSYMFKYFSLYVAHFGLLEHIKFRHQVTRVCQSDDYESTGRWLVSVTDLVEGIVEHNLFDGVMICTGHHIFPNVPSFPGLDEFEGPVMHTHSLKTAKGFENQRVLVIGIGNSAVDAAVELSSVSQNLYLSTRRGSWIYSRVGPSGTPYDIFLQKRAFELIRRLNFFRWADWLLEYLLNRKFDHAKYKLQPKHRVLSAHPTINDALPNCILSGRIVLKQDVGVFKKNGVVFQGEEKETRIDAVVLATGYDIKFPFLDESILKVDSNDVKLYKLIFPPKLTHPTLSFIGLIQPLGALFPIAEAQSRWFALLMQNKLNLPSSKVMEEEINSRRQENTNLYVGSPRHTIQVTWIPYMDDICSQFGAKPNLLWLAVTDHKLFYACCFGPCTPYQYRLHGPHPWSGARDAILSVEERIQAPLNTCNRD